MATPEETHIQRGHLRYQLPYYLCRIKPVLNLCKVLQYYEEDCRSRLFLNINSIEWSVRKINNLSYHFQCFSKYWTTMEYWKKKRFSDEYFIAVLIKFNLWKKLYICTSTKALQKVLFPRKKLAFILFLEYSHFLTVAEIRCFDKVVLAKRFCLIKYKKYSGDQNPWQYCLEFCF